MRSLLRGRSEKSWIQMFSAYSGVGDGSVMTDTMGKRIRSSLQSPRIAGAHADLLRWIHSGQRKGARSTLWAKMESQHYAKNALVVWAKEDPEYHYPRDMNPKIKRIDVPYGHYFPTFQYKETAVILAEWFDNVR